MTDRELSAYLHAIEKQFHYANFSYQEYVNSINSLISSVASTQAGNHAVKYEHSIGVWMNLQNFLNACGNVSKLLWSKNLARSKFLRDTLRIPDDSPLRVRELRNFFEHFDERLDEALNRKSNTFMHSYFATRSSIPVGNITHLGTLIVDESAVLFTGKDGSSLEVQLNQIVNAIDSLATTHRQFVEDYNSRKKSREC